MKNNPLAGRPRRNFLKASAAALPGFTFSRLLAMRGLYLASLAAAAEWRMTLDNPWKSTKTNQLKLL